MKKLSLFFIAFFVITAAYSQDQFLRLGPKVGISSTDISIGDGLQDEEYLLESGDAKVGFHVGAFARLSIAGFFVQPEALFTSAGGKIRIDDVNGGELIRDYRLNKIDVPVMIGKKFANLIRLQVGPTFSLLLNDNADEDISGAVDEVNENWKNALIGYQLGIGLDIGNLILDLKYEGNLSKFGDQISIGGEAFETDMRNNQFILSLGFNLL